MEIKAFKYGDEKQILQLFELSFGKKLSKHYWDWRFLNNPFSKDVLIELMWDNDKLVGHYAVSPVDMKINGGVIKSALSMTTMTHPDYSGKGIFSKLALSLYEKLKYQHKYDLVWGFPNSNSHYGFIKNLGWKDIAIQCMSVITYSQTVKLKTNVDYVIVDHISDEIALLFNQNIKLISINKTPNYLNWRYVSNPTADYKVLVLKNKNGAIIYKKLKSFVDDSKFEIDILELAYDNDIITLIELLSAILIEDVEFEKINIWDSLYSSNQQYLEKLGFKISAPLTYLGCLDINNSISDLLIYNNWDISMGYSDVF